MGPSPDEKRPLIEPTKKKNKDQITNYVKRNNMSKITFKIITKKRPLHRWVFFTPRTR